MAVDMVAGFGLVEGWLWECRDAERGCEELFLMNWRRGITIKEVTRLLFIVPCGRMKLELVPTFS
jgi:hypothetical protein